MIRSTQSEKMTWIDIQDPTEKDIEFLQKNFDFHPLVLGELIPPGSRPKVEHHDDYLFFVLYHPIFDKKKGEVERRELDIIVTRSHIVTSHYETILPLRALFDQVNLYEKTRTEYMEETTGHLLYYIIAGILQSALQKTEELEKKIDVIEKDIFRGNEKRMVFAISELSREVIDMRRIFAPHRSTFESLVREGEKFWGEALLPYLEDLRGTFANIWNEVEEHRETLTLVAETNESLLRTKSNEIMQVLTIFSVVFLPLTLIASIWGMNTRYLPFHDLSYDFWLIMGIIIVSFGLMMWYFRTRKWL